MSKEEKINIHLKGFEDIEPYDSTLAERELLKAILIGALQDLRKNGIEKRKATEFFMSQEDDYIFSFLSICDFLRLNPKKILVLAGLEKGKVSKDCKEMEEIYRQLDLENESIN